MSPDPIVFAPLFLPAVDIKPVPDAIFKQGYLRAIEYLNENTEPSIAGRRAGTHAIFKENGYFGLYLYLLYPSAFK
jgi:hypothetical protein